MKIYKKVVFGSIWKKLIFDSFDLRGVFWELQNIGAFFWRRLFLGKLQLTSIALKRAKERPKPTSFGPPNVLHNLLSRNPTLSRRCEVNKFNLVTFYKYQPCSSLITQFSRPRAAKILSSFCFKFQFFSFLYKQIVDYLLKIQVLI